MQLLLYLRPEDSGVVEKEAIVTTLMHHFIAIAPKLVNGQKKMLDKVGCPRGGRPTRGDGM